jgi:hypothetical protein
LELIDRLPLGDDGLARFFRDQSNFLWQEAELRVSGIRLSDREANYQTSNDSQAPMHC